jgi:hypothetical protein
VLELLDEFELGLDRDELLDEFELGLDRDELLYFMILLELELDLLLEL